MPFQFLKAKIWVFAGFFILLFQAPFAFGAKVKVSGKASEYAHNTIQLSRLHDFISEETIKLGNIRFDAAGTFSFETELEETSFCFADFDGYRGMIYLEPGRSYEIIFPPKRYLTEVQKRNPFVKAEPVWFGVLEPDKNELNYLIQKFEQAYAKYENQYFDQIFLNRSEALVDTVKNLLDKEFGKTSSAFFESHKLFRKANLEFALHQGKSVGFMNAYFSKERPIYNLAAYSTLFNQTFTNYFSTLVNSVNGGEIRKLINSSMLLQLDEYFQSKLHFNKELSHWVLLKSMYDAYYNKQFSKAEILKMLDQAMKSGWSSYENETAQLIRSKLVYLASGTAPPPLVLSDLNGKNVNLSEFRNKYIYLHFTDPKNSICQQHLNTLKTVAANYKDKLVIINVIASGIKFTNSYNWAGLFTKADENEKERFKVKTFPTSFLIGKDGKLLLSPAPNPIDGLDRQLGQLFKSEYFKELQKSNQK